MWGARTLVQTRDAAARANAGAWLGPGTHPGGLGVLNAHNGPCPQPAACPTPTGAQQGQLDLAACDRLRSATRRPGAAGRCGGCPRTHPGGLGVLNARDAPCPKPAACPALRRCAGPAPSHRPATGTERDASAERCGAVRAGRSCWAIPCGGGPPTKGAHELCRLRMRLELRRHPRHGGTSLLGPTSERRDPLPSIEPVRHRNGAAASPKAARRACCWYV